MSIILPFYLVDAFTLGRNFTGNPAAVVVLPPANRPGQTKMTLPAKIFASSSAPTLQLSKTASASSPSRFAFLSPSSKKGQQQQQQFPPPAATPSSPPSPASPSPSSYSVAAPTCEDDVRVTKVLQTIAAEMKQSETVFVQYVPGAAAASSSPLSPSPSPPSSPLVPSSAAAPRAVFFIRWFSPTVEVALCGHATLAASHCLFTEHHIPHVADLQVQYIDFVTTIGRTFRVSREISAAGGIIDMPTASSSQFPSSSSSSDNNNNSNGKAGVVDAAVVSGGADGVGMSSGDQYSLRFPNNAPRLIPSPILSTNYASKVIDALREAVVDGDKLKILNVWFHAPSKKYLVELDSPETVRGLRLDTNKLHRALRREYVLSVTVTAQTRNKAAVTTTAASNTSSNNNTCNKMTQTQTPPWLLHNAVAVSRHFAPWLGIPEDPVTGAAHTVLAPVFAQRLQRMGKDTPFFQASPGRGGVIKARVGRGVVTLTGQANTVVKGVLNLSADEVKSIAPVSRL